MTWLALPLAVKALHAQTVSLDWLLGTWQADMNRTLDRFVESTGRPPITPEGKELVTGSNQLRFLITDRHFTVQTIRSPFGSKKERWRYSVQGATESSITVQLTRFLSPETPPLTLFKESENIMFTGSPQHPEFFVRINS